MQAILSNYGNLTLNEILLVLGMSKQKAKRDILGYSYDIYNESAVVVFTGDAYAVRDWLVETGRMDPTEGHITPAMIRALDRYRLMLTSYGRGSCNLDTLNGAIRDLRSAASFDRSPVESGA